MRNCKAARLLRVVCEIALCIHVCVVADNLDGVLVRADRAVCAKAPELAGMCPFRSGVRILFDVEGQVRNIIVNADGEAFFRC